MLHVIRFLYIPFPVTDYSPDCKCDLSKVLTDRCLVNKGSKFFLPLFYNHLCSSTLQDKGRKIFRPLSCKLLYVNDLSVLLFLLRVEWGELG